MNETRYKWILYVIVAVIIGTIGIQVYWNYKNYEINKQQLINDVQLSLDQAVEKYYAQLAEEQTIGFAFESRQHDSVYSRYTMFDSLIGVLDFSSKKITDLDSLGITLNSDNVVVYKGMHADSLLTSIKGDHFPRLKRNNIPNSTKRKFELSHFRYQPDSIVTENLERLAKSIIKKTPQSNNRFSVPSVNKILRKIINIFLNKDILRILNAGQIDPNLGPITENFGFNFPFVKKEQQESEEKNHHHLNFMLKVFCPLMYISNIRKRD